MYNSHSTYEFVNKVSFHLTQEEFHNLETQRETLDVYN